MMMSYLVNRLTHHQPRGNYDSAAGDIARAIGLLFVIVLSALSLGFDG
jgi:hypothetical protein